MVANSVCLNMLPKGCLTVLTLIIVLLFELLEFWMLLVTAIELYYILVHAMIDLVQVDLQLLLPEKQQWAYSYHSHRSKQEPPTLSKFDPSKISPKVYPKGLKLRPLACRWTVIRRIESAQNSLPRCISYFVLTVQKQRYQHQQQPQSIFWKFFTR